MKDVIIATENDGKLEEIKSLLGNTFERYYCLKDFPEKVVVDEDQPSYVANALKKARKVGDRFSIATLSDDSGLEVEALQGRPGVYSSRYGKDDNDRLNKAPGRAARVFPSNKEERSSNPMLFCICPSRKDAMFFMETLRAISVLKGTEQVDSDMILFFMYLS